MASPAQAALARKPLAIRSATRSSKRTLTSGRSSDAANLRWLSLYGSNLQKSLARMLAEPLMVSHIFGDHLE